VHNIRIRLIGKLKAPPKAAERLGISGHQIVTYLRFRIVIRILDHELQFICQQFKPGIFLKCEKGDFVTVAAQIADEV
jgi:hypothetical protein